jgi:molybdate transport system substrate-binding protein
MTLHILSAGAAKGLVGALAGEFERATGHDIAGAFGAIGAMREKYLAGERCDTIILSAAMIRELAAAGEVDPGSIADLGRVRTGVAVPAGAPLPPVGDAAQLREALARARAVYFPDPQRATAGIHFMKVLGELGLAQALGERLRAFPNGAAAMAEMARAVQAGELAPADAIGVTQVTEILYTPGVQLVAPLPAQFELATVYTAAVTRRAADPSLAARLVALLSGPQSAPVRAAGGFE